MTLLKSLLDEPMVEPFVECPGCRRLLRPGVEGCPECGQAITEEYARSNVVAFVLRSQACDLANRVVTDLKPFMVYVLIVSAAVFAFNQYVREWTIVWLAAFLFLVVCSAASLLPVRGWFRRYGRLDISDEEYLRARRRVKGTLRMGLAVLAVQLIALAFWRL